jgi:hypothetical protein
LLQLPGRYCNFATGQNLGFVPLHGERDEEHQFGLTIPFRGWTLDADNLLTRAKNFFDHNNLNASDVFFPVTIQGARINGWELTLHSPRIRDRAQIYLTYSNQLALGFGNINGGLTDFYSAMDLVCSITISGTLCTWAGSTVCRGASMPPRMCTTVRASQAVIRRFPAIISNRTRHLIFPSRRKSAKT